MKISDFTEKQIRDSIIKKIKPLIPSGCKHQKCVILKTAVEICSITAMPYFIRIFYNFAVVDCITWRVSGTGVAGYGF
jgi:hypothetical protein